MKYFSCQENVPVLILQERLQEKLWNYIQTSLSSFVEQSLFSRCLTSVLLLMTIYILGMDLFARCGTFIACLNDSIWGNKPIWRGEQTVRLLFHRYHNFVSYKCTANIKGFLQTSFKLVRRNFIPDLFYSYFWYFLFASVLVIFASDFSYCRFHLYEHLKYILYDPFTMI